MLPGVLGIYRWKESFVVGLDEERSACGGFYDHCGGSAMRRTHVGNVRLKYEEKKRMSQTVWGNGLILLRERERLNVANG